jgi:hypothetical protein
MNFTSYTDFRSAVLKMIDGDDINSGALSQSTLDLLIAMGEQAVYYGTTGIQSTLPPLRCAEMEAPLSITATGNLAPLPADCLELISVQVDGEYPMDYVAKEGQLRLLKAGGGSGAARKYTQQGLNLLFFPTVSDGTTIGGRYYKKAADIASGTLNAAFTRYPDVWLYAAVAEAAPFIGEDNRLPLWKAQYAGRLMAALANERARLTHGSRLTQVAR